MVGPAKRTEGNDKEFVIDGCKVTVTSANGSVRSLALELNPKCTIDLNKFLQNTAIKFPSANKMTFGQFEAAQDGTGQFMSECLDCGNSMDPIVSEFWTGSHADGVLEVELSVNLVSSNAIDASFVWQKAMALGEGAEWWQFGKFNCRKTKYDLVAHRAFKDVKIDAIRIGYGLEKPRCGS